MFDIYVIESDALIVCRPKGILDAKMTQGIVEFIEIKELETETGFNRFSDLTYLEGIHLSSADVLRLATRRREFNPNGIRVKSGFLATDPLVAGIAHMYEQLLDSPRIEVRVFGDMQSAAEWLGVKVDSLKF